MSRPNKDRDISFTVSGSNISTSGRTMVTIYASIIMNEVENAAIDAYHRGNVDFQVKNKNII